MNRSGLLWGAALVILGILLLLRTFGIIQIDIGGLICPVALIIAGISVVWGTLRGPQRGQAEQVSIPLENANKAEVQIRIGAGQLKLSGGAGMTEILSGTFEGGVEHSSRLDGDTIRATLRTPEVDWMNAPWMWGEQRREWDVKLNSGVNIAVLDINAGASDADLDLSSLRIADLKLNIGASSGKITLPANAGITRAEIGAGAASVKIKVPNGVAAHIRFTGGAARLQVDKSRFLIRNDDFESPDYETAANKIDIHIDAGAGSIEVS
jgi:hypothetical protein